MKPATDTHSGAGLEINGFADTLEFSLQRVRALTL
jgi:hypothetical protein